VEVSGLVLLQGRYYPDIYLEGLTRPRNNSVKRVLSSTRILNRETTSISLQSYCYIGLVIVTMVLYLECARKARPREETEHKTEVKKFHDKKLGNLYSLVNIIRVTKLKIMTGMRNATHIKKNCKYIQILEAILNNRNQFLT
jgi:hypothetical protein